MAKRQNGAAWLNTTGKAPFLVMPVDEPASKKKRQGRWKSMPIKINVEYDGPVPVEVCKHLCDRILGCTLTGYFAPCDPMDAYGQIWSEIESIARNLPVLNSATPKTYLHRAVNQLISRYFDRQVRPMREEYRQMQGQIEAANAAAAAKALRDAPEGKDVGFAAYAAAAEGGNYKNSSERILELTSRNLADRLAGEPSAQERRDQAEMELELIYASMRINLPRRSDPEKIIRAFRAYVEADGNLFAAAVRAHIGKAWFYRCWPKWLALAKKCVEICGLSRH